MRSALRHGMVLAFSALFLFANPGYFGCSESEEDFEFGESDMQTYIVGTWTGEMTYPDGSSSPYTLTLEQSSQQTVNSALCGTRSFIRAAAACVAMTSMPVVGTLSTDDSRFVDTQVEGSFEVYGAAFDNGQLWLELPDQVSMSAHGNGSSFEAGTLQDVDGQGSFTITKLTR